MARSAGKAVLVGSLDSIVTLCTNASAALIIVAMVTMITIGGRIKEILFQEYASQLSPAALAEVKQRRTQIAGMLERVKAHAGEIPDVKVPQELMGVDDIRSLVTDLENIVSDPSSLRALASAQQLSRILTLERDLASLQREIEQYRIALGAPPSEQVRFRVINLPEQRFAPEGMTAVNFICRGNTLHLFDVQTLSRAFENGVRQALGQPEGKVLITNEDLPKLVGYFAQNDLGDPYLRLSLDHQRGGLLVLYYMPRPGNPGEAVDQVRSENSRFRTILKELDPNRHVIRFLAFSDSFEIYNVARQIATEAGFQCGWEPRSKDEALREVVFGSGSRGPGRALID